MALYSVSFQMGAKTIQSSISRDADHPNPYEVTLPVGKAGSLTTRTDDDTGTFACTAHGLAVNDYADVYWSTAGNVRYGMLVTAVGDADTVTLDGGAGDVLPAEAAAVVITEQVGIDTSIDADRISMIGVYAQSATSPSTAVAHLHCKDANGTTIEEMDLVGGVHQIYDVTG